MGWGALIAGMSSLLSKSESIWNSDVATEWAANVSATDDCRSRTRAEEQSAGSNTRFAGMHTPFTMCRRTERSDRRLNSAEQFPKLNGRMIGERPLLGQLVDRVLGFRSLGVVDEHAGPLLPRDALLPHLLEMLS